MATESAETAKVQPNHDPEIVLLCAQIRESSLAVHHFLRHGHLEKIYENALAHRLRNLGLDVKQQYPLHVFDEDGTLLGNFFADLLIDGQASDRAESLPATRFRAHRSSVGLPPRCSHGACHAD